MNQELTYISNLDLKTISGGGTGINAATYHILKNKFNVAYVGPISPPSNNLQRTWSRIQKFSGFPRNYFFYSQDRLNSIAQIIHRRSISVDSPLFFHGITPWIAYKPVNKYFAHADACFATYVEIFNSKEKFKLSDLKRIILLEKEWLRNAAAVFFRSDWAREQTIEHYKISGENLHVTGMAGFSDIPESDEYKKEPLFLFIAKEFEAKGGRLCIEAFIKIRKEFPEVKLVIIGELPEREIQNLPGVVCTGMLYKEKASDKKILYDYFKRAMAHVHPTTKDVNPLVIAETSYYGCPTIAPNLFAIGNQIIHNETGFLLKLPMTADEIANYMRWMLTSKCYLSMRRETRKYALENQTWEAVKTRMLPIMNSLI